MTLGFVGAVVMAIDKEGTNGPKTCGLLATLAVAGIHGLAVQQMFYANDIGVDPAYGVWAGFAGLGVVIVGCVMGTRTEHLPAGVR
jgi:multidrug transporter EmrE-like cation transporter